MWGVNTLDVSQYLQELDLNKPIPISLKQRCAKGKRKIGSTAFLRFLSIIVIIKGTGTSKESSTSRKQTFLRILSERMLYYPKMQKHFL